MNLQEMIDKMSNEALSKQIGMVYQIWDDGEITLQKCGDLLWQRTLHCMRPQLCKTFTELNFPNKSGSHSYAFVSREDAESIRTAMEEKLNG